METLWKISATIAFKNNSVEEIICIKDSASPPRLVGSQEAWIDLGKDTRFRGIFGLSSIQQSINVKDIFLTWILWLLDQVDLVM